MGFRDVVRLSSAFWAVDDLDVSPACEKPHSGTRLSGLGSGDGLRQRDDSGLRRYLRKLEQCLVEC